MTKCCELLILLLLFASCILDLIGKAACIFNLNWVMRRLLSISYKWLYTIYGILVKNNNLYIWHLCERTTNAIIIMDILLHL